MDLPETTQLTLFTRPFPPSLDDANGFGGEYSQGSPVLNCSEEEVTNLSFFGDIQGPISVTLRVYEKVMKGVLAECESPNRSSNSPCFPSPERSIEGFRRQIMMSSGHMDGDIQDPISVNLSVYEKVMKGVLPECESPNRSSNSPCFPSPERSIEVSRRQIMMSSDHMDEVSVQGNSKECQSPASSRPSSNARRRVRKKKRKTEDESSDSEVFVPKHVYVHGQRRRGCRSGNTGRGMLDSGTFMHYFMHLWEDFSGDKVSSFAYFEPYWFHLYSKEKNRAKVLGWIKKKGILSKKYVLVPIVLW